MPPREGSKSRESGGKNNNALRKEWYTNTENCLRSSKIPYLLLGYNLVYFLNFQHIHTFTL